MMLCWIIPFLLGGYSDCDPPDLISNSEVKPVNADDSMVLGHAKVGNCQAFYSKNPDVNSLGFFLLNFYLFYVC